MFRRKKVEPIKPRKIIRRKCKHCGKMKTNPYCFTTVPPINHYDKIPVYNKNAVKTDRIDLRDYTNTHGVKIKKKVDISYFCDQECHGNFTGKVYEPTRFNEL
jgi:hypothetical protein